MAGPRVKITATKEVVLSAGVIGTPHILKLSGIGPRDELAHFGIPSVVDLPDVGANLADHPVLANYFQVERNDTWDDVLRDSSIMEQKLGQWQSSKQGLFTDSPANTIAFVRFPADSPALKGVQDPAAGTKSAHAELVFMVCTMLSMSCSCVSCWYGREAIRNLVRRVLQHRVTL